MPSNEQEKDRAAALEQYLKAALTIIFRSQYCVVVKGEGHAG